MWAGWDGERARPAGAASSAGGREDVRRMKADTAMSRWSPSPTSSDKEVIGRTPLVELRVAKEDWVK